MLQSPVVCSAPVRTPGRGPLGVFSPERRHMTRIIAFFNQKGGTAKTTSTLNVAAALAERGRRVVAIDMDPQASLTMATGVDIAALDASIYDLLLDDALDL